MRNIAAITSLVAMFLFVACAQITPPQASPEDEIHPFVNIAPDALNGLKESWNIRPGVVIFDYDRDGDQDFYVTNAYGFANWLYRNEGDGTFTDVAEAAGVDLRKTHGTGVVACDINNDGYQDLYVGAQGSLTDRLDFRAPAEGDQNKDRLLLNNRDGSFSDVTDSAFGNIVNKRSAMSMACADIDNDGWLDIYVGNLAEDEFRGMHVPFQNGQYNVLYRNKGDLTFEEVAHYAGVQGPQVFMRNPDGQPVLYEDNVTGELYEGFDPNLRDDLGNPVGDPTGQTTAVLFFDYDSDGDQDLWVANDGDKLHIYRNDSTPGEIHFTPVERAMGVDKVGAWMGFAVGDYDSDADLDVFITNVGFHPRLDEPFITPRPYCAYHEQFSWGTCLHYLLRNEGVQEVPGVGNIGVFYDVAPSTQVAPSPLMPPMSLNASMIHSQQRVPTGLSAYDFGFGTTFFDYDNDGDQDLYWLGSTVDRGEAPGGDVFPSAGRMMRNMRGEAFEDITVRAQLLDIDRARYAKIDPLDPTKDRHVHRIDPMYHENGKGVVHGDLNGDGYADLIGTNSKGSLWEDARQVSFIETGGPLFVWMNPGGNNNWITLRLQGRMAIDGIGSNADGIGARVYLTAQLEKGGEPTMQVQEVRGGSSYLSMDSVELEFGLGQDDTVDKIEIQWPSGRTQTLENVSSNQVLLIQEPEG